MSHFRNNGPNFGGQPFSSSFAMAGAQGFRSSGIPSYPVVGAGALPPATSAPQYPVLQGQAFGQQGFSGMAFGSGAQYPVLTPRQQVMNGPVNVGQMINVGHSAGPLQVTAVNPAIVQHVEAPTTQYVTGQVNVQELQHANLQHVDLQQINLQQLHQFGHQFHVGQGPMQVTAVNPAIIQHVEGRALPPVVVQELMEEVFQEPPQMLALPAPPQQRQLIVPQQQQQIVVQQQQQQLIVPQRRDPIIFQAPPMLPPPPPAPVPMPEIHVVDARRPRDSGLEQEIASMRKQLMQTESSEARLRLKVEEFTRKLRISVKREATSRQLTAELARLREQLMDVELRLVASEGYRGGAERDIGLLTLRLQEGEQRGLQVDVLAQQLGSLTQQLEETLLHIQSLDGERATHEQRLIVLEIELKKANDAVWQARSGFDGERAQFEDQIYTLTQRLTAAEKDRDEMGRQVGMAEKRLREANQELESVTLQVGQSEQWVAQRAQLQETIFNLQIQITTFESHREEARQQIIFWKTKVQDSERLLEAALQRIAQLEAHVARLELEIRNVRNRLETKVDVSSTTNVKETYKVKTFEMAAKLAKMDGTDDGLFNGLPIEVEGEGLYKELVAAGRQAKPQSQGQASSMTTTSQTYKVQSFDVAERLAKMSGSNDGKYNGLPIEVTGQGLYTDLLRSGVRSSAAAAGGAGGSGAGAGGNSYKVSGGAAAGGSSYATTSGAGAVTGGATSGGQTYIVTSMEMAATISRMGGSDDGTYKGLPIEVKGMGLYRDLRGKK